MSGFQEVQELAEKFFKQQNLIRVANKIIEIAGKGDIDRYDECQKLLDDAAMAGITKEELEIYNDLNSLFLFHYPLKNGLFRSIKGINKDNNDS